MKNMIKKQKPPKAFRLKEGNEAKLVNIQDQLRLDNPNQTVNYMIEEWDYVIKWREGLVTFAALTDFLNRMRLELELNNKKGGRK